MPASIPQISSGRAPTVRYNRTVPTRAGENALDDDRREVTQRLRRGLADEELRAVARWVVRAYLEVERGHRDIRMLRHFLAPHLYFALETADRRPGSRPVAAGDVGGAHFNRLGAGRGYAAVVVRDLDGRWRAVTLVLRRNDAGAWLVVDLRRIHAPSVTSPPGATVGDDAPSRKCSGGSG